MTPSECNSRLDRLTEELDPLRKKLIALGLVADQLEQHGLVPVLVGGTAVEFYTAGGYASKDVDLALPSVEIVDDVFAALGFRTEGRYWIREELDLLFEAPAGSLAGEDAPRKVIEIDGLKVTILGIEDLLIDRMRAWVHWQSAEDERWARRLATLHAETIDWGYLRDKTSVVEAESIAMAILERGVRGA